MDLKKMKEGWNTLMKHVSDSVSKGDFPNVAASLAFLREVAKDATNKEQGSAHELAKSKIIEYVKAKGRKLEGKASTLLVMDGWSVPMHPTRTGTDPKKLEAKLRAKKKDQEAGTKLCKKYMVTVESFGLAADTTARLVKDKVLTTQDIEDCQYDESWTITTPTMEE